MELLLVCPGVDYSRPAVPSGPGPGPAPISPLKSYANLYECILLGRGAIASVRF